MHPSPDFRHGDRGLHEALIDQIGFGMVFAQTPHGPRVAHAALLSNGEGRIRFHLARGNALTRHLADADPLILVNGPDAYVSARWYDDPDQVPTWNYVALELEGPVQRLDRDELLDLLEKITARHEGRIEAGEPWTMDKLSDANRERLLRGIVGFEMDVRAWRDTVKISQNKPAEEREHVAQGLEAAGSQAMAEMMRGLAA